MDLSWILRTVLVGFFRTFARSKTDNSKEMTQKEIVKMVLEKLGGCAYLTDIGILAKYYIGDSTKAKDIRNNVRRELNSNPDLFCHVEGKPNGWWQLKTHKEEIDNLKAIIAEQNKVIEEQKKVPTEDAFVKKFVKETKHFFKHDRKKADIVRQIMIKVGRSDADKELDSWIDGKELPTTAQAIQKQTEALLKVAERPTIHGDIIQGDKVAEKTVIPSVGNYKPQITTQNIETPLPPSGSQQEKKQLEDE